MRRRAIAAPAPFVPPLTSARRPWRSLTGRLTGNFPGGTADLRWDFSIAGQQITRLVIAP
jgi:hypothetical protein